jgi:hypothetical protein
MSFTEKPLNALDELNMVSFPALVPGPALWGWDAAGASDSSADSGRPDASRQGEGAVRRGAVPEGWYTNDVGTECVERSGRALIPRGEIPLGARVLAIASERRTPLAPRKAR